MQWTSLNDIREKYLAFFESKGHLRLPSYPLIPHNDKSLLLINSGMAPMKKFFTGEEIPPRNRVTTCQKCIRTPDLERVGKTARHGTYFEMLGNFSFGDYFKNEAIPWAWEFLTKTLEIPENLLWPSVYEQDDEAYALWRDVIGVPEERIVKLGKADNFWEHGTGPCGPCSEIYFDRGIKYGCGSPDCKPGCDCDRFMEIWNNVFSQFNNMGDGTYIIIAGERRWRASQKVGLQRIPAYIRTVDDENMMEMALIENIQREDLNPLEEALAYKALAEEYDMTQEELSQKVGKSRSAIANTLRLLDLPDEVLEMLKSADISAGHARALLTLEDEELMKELSIFIDESGDFGEITNCASYGHFTRNGTKSWNATGKAF